MDELFEAFQALEKELYCCNFIDGNDMIHLRIFADRSGHVGRVRNQTLYRYDYNTLELTPVVWDNPQEGIRILEDCCDVVTLQHHPFEWR